MSERDFYLVKVGDDGEVMAAKLPDEVGFTAYVEATQLGGPVAYDNQGDSAHSKVDAATECLAAIMPEIEDAGEDDDDEEPEYGWITISQMVTDDSGEAWLETQRYLYYSPEEASARYAARLTEKGWRLADD